MRVVSAASALTSAVLLVLVLLLSTVEAMAATTPDGRALPSCRKPNPHPLSAGECCFGIKHCAFKSPLACPRNPAGKLGPIVKQCESKDHCEGICSETPLGPGLWCSNHSGPTWTCSNCKHVYDASRDDPAKKNTPFELLPATWKCPVCGAPKSAYVKSVNAVGETEWSHEDDEEVIVTAVVGGSLDRSASAVVEEDAAPTRHPPPVFVRDETATVVRQHQLGYTVIEETLVTQSYYLRDGDLIFTDFKSTPIPMPQGDYAILGFGGEMVDCNNVSVPLDVLYNHHWLLKPISGPTTHYNTPCPANNVVLPSLNEYGDFTCEYQCCILGSTTQAVNCVTSFPIWPAASQFWLCCRRVRRRGRVPQHARDSAGRLWLPRQEWNQVGGKYSRAAHPGPRQRSARN